MTDTRGSRAALGFAAAVLVAVSVALLGGCLYAAMMMTGHEREFMVAILSGDPDAWSGLMFVSGAAAMMGAAIAMLVTLLIVWPLYYLSLKLHRTAMRDYVLAGCAISILVIGVLALPHSPMANIPDEFFWLVAIAIAGPAATLTLWRVARPDIE